MLKEVDDMMGDDLFMPSGPEPGVSAPVAVNEAGKQILPTLPGPESVVPVSNTVNGAVHAW